MRLYIIPLNARNTLLSFQRQQIKADELNAKLIPGKNTRLTLVRYTQVRMTKSDCCTTWSYNCIHKPGSWLGVVLGLVNSATQKREMGKITVPTTLAKKLARTHFGKTTLSGGSGL
jgi:hypothetical protein